MRQLWTGTCNYPFNLKLILIQVSTNLGFTLQQVTNEIHVVTYSETWINRTAGDHQKKS